MIFADVEECGESLRDMKPPTPRVAVDKPIIFVNLYRRVFIVVRRALREDIALRVFMSESVSVELSEYVRLGEFVWFIISFHYAAVSSLLFTIFML